MLYTTFDQQEVSSPRTFYKGTRHSWKFFIMFKDVFVGCARCDDERVGMRSYKAGICGVVQVSSARVSPTLNCFVWAPSQIRHYNSTLTTFQLTIKTLIDLPSLGLRQLWNGLTY
jgi:hypothetical protein